MSQIPKIIHQIWINDTHLGNPKLPIPTEWQKGPEAWKTLHPNFKYVLWTDDTVIPFLTTYYPEFLELYYSYPNLIQRADMVRYFILHDFGGIYSDLDNYPVENLEKYFVHDIDGYFVYSANSNCFTNCLMVSKKGSRIMKEIFQRLKKNEIPWWAIGKHLTVMTSTGPLMLTDALQETEYLYVVLPKKKFNPYGVSENFENIKENISMRTMEGKSWNGVDSIIFNFVNTRKPFFITLGIVFLILIIVSLLYYIFKYKKTQKYCSEVKQYCDTKCSGENVPDLNI